MKYTIILVVLLSILTFAGATYVLLNHGQVSAGYAVIPMVFVLIFVFSKK